MRQVIIIGSGPAGFTAAIYAARANLNPVLVASSVEVGGELMKTTEVENFPGFPEGIQGPDLMARMQEQAERFGTEVLYDDVTELELDGEVKKVTLGSGTVLEAASVIYATGSAYRTLGIPGEDRLSGHGVSWCATCDGFFFRERTIAVPGRPAAWNVAPVPCVEACESKEKQCDRSSSSVRDPRGSPRRSTRPART